MNLSIKKSSESELAVYQGEKSVANASRIFDSGRYGWFIKTHHGRSSIQLPNSEEGVLDAVKELLRPIPCYQVAVNGACQKAFQLDIIDIEPTDSLIRRILEKAVGSFYLKSVKEIKRGSGYEVKYVPRYGSEEQNITITIGYINK